MREAAAENRAGGGLRARFLPPVAEVALAVVALVLLFALASCGGGDETTTGQASGGQSDDAAALDGESGEQSVSGAGDCPVDAGTIEAAFGVDSVQRETNVDGGILAPVPTHAAGVVDSPPVVYRYICSFESPEAVAVAVFSSPPAPPVTPSDVDDPSMAGIEEELLSPAADMRQIRQAWENAAEKISLAELSITDRPEWGEDAFLVRIDEDDGPVDVWYYATAPGMAIRIVGIAPGPQGGEAVPEDAVDAFAATVFDAS